MRTSPLALLKDPTIIVLAAGHGGADTGACNGPHKERDQAIYMVDVIASDLSDRGLNVVIAPHEHDTHDSIPWVNTRFGLGDAWVIEVHRDSASGLTDDDASRRCGIYSGPSESSQDLGRFVRDVLLRKGAHPHTWAKPDTASRFERLGWIRQTRPAAHLLELGFMEGNNSDAHLAWLSSLGAAAIYEAFTGHAS